MRDVKNTLPRKPCHVKQDESIMGTNNSSIVSKRSVERLYFPDEPSFFRYFVKKPQRRSPLINRGYWLRMKAIDLVVRNFLEVASHKRKVVINLGCGYDPLPWQCLSRYPVACNGVTFVDIDYRDLILKKRKIVQEEPKLYSVFSNLVASEGHVLLHSDQYLQVGCDLRELTQLDEALSNVIDLQNCTIIFTAEVSITYMDVDAADSLIKWTSNLPDAQFCLLEQLLPASAEHPFAQTMMAHFEKLTTPLGAVRKYPSTESQQLRFEALGWSDVLVRNLWELWSSVEFLSPEERMALDVIEPFDEWEEFALFANHYFLLTASMNNTCQKFKNLMTSKSSPSHLFGWRAAYSYCQKSQGCRRYSAALFVRSQDRGKDRIALFSGMGKTTRINSRDEYTFSEQDNAFFTNSGSSLTPGSRMCHTITDLGDAGALLVGGRTSPETGLSDCWVYHKWLDIWERVDNLPWPLYRHQALKVGSSSVLVSTGRINSYSLSSSFLLWSRKTGWIKCTFSGNIPLPVYGSVFIGYPCGEPTAECGILSGGMSTDGVVVEEALRWVLTDIGSENPKIDFRTSATSPNICRFGACTIRHLGEVYVLGGIVKNKLLSKQEEICRIEITSEGLVSYPILKASQLSLWPLLIGSSVLSTGKSIVIIGGSAVCFSFGTYWNQACLTLMPCSSTDHEEWRFLHTVDVKTLSPNLEDTKSESKELFSIPRIKLRSKAHFDEVRNSGNPVIFEGLDVGPCTTNWSIEYLKQAIGEKREVIVHEASAEHMNFTAKNFRYRSMELGEFTSQIKNGGRLYLRSLSDQPSETPANIYHDFKSICSEFSLPPELSYVMENAHSSPLRISGPVIMWLHYDTLANVLCQIKGSKRILLFHPSDFKYFGFEPGSSCSSINVFENLQSQKLGCSKPYEAFLNPGDVIYIPAFWLHAASPVSGVSIAVNVFFRNLSVGYATGKDVYANRDLRAYEKGRLDIARIIASFDKLPAEVRSFYLQRLAIEFTQKASS